MNNIPFTPQFINPSSNPLNDTVNWMRVSGSYVAGGGGNLSPLEIFMMMRTQIR
jgi:hypothetical protein